MTWTVRNREPVLVQRGEVLTLADRRRHVLLELPHEQSIPLGRLLYRLQAEGVCSILSHPERNQALARGVEVFGVNPRNARKHAEFRRKFNFPFPLLVDSGQKIARQYHANGLVVKRTVYLIGPDGTILFARRGKPSPSEVLAAAR